MYNINNINNINNNNKNIVIYKIEYDYLKDMIIFMFYSEWI